jgi:hypothetical protein
VINGVPIGQVLLLPLTHVEVTKICCPPQPAVSSQQSTIQSKLWWQDEDAVSKIVQYFYRFCSRLNTTTKLMFDFVMVTYLNSTVLLATTTSTKLVLDMRQEGSLFVNIVFFVCRPSKKRCSLEMLIPRRIK